MSRRFRLIAAASAVAVPLVILGGWVGDTAAQQGKTMRGVSVAGRDVAGQARAQLQATVGQIATQIESRPIDVKAGPSVFHTTAGEVGLLVDRATVVEQALAARRAGSTWSRFRSWMSSFGDATDVPLPVHLVPEKAQAWVQVQNDKVQAAVLEPSFADQGGKLTVVAGTPGTGMDAASLVAALGSLHPETGSGTLTVNAATVDLPPLHSIAEAQAVIDQVTKLTANPVVVHAGAGTTTIPPEELRSWLTGRIGPNGPELTFQDALALTQLRGLLAGAATTPVDATYAVDGDAVNIVGGTPGQKCCTADAPAVLLKALQAGPTGPIELPTIAVQPNIKVSDLQAAGIKEKVSSFTTKHPCCQDRVKNIHLMADLLRGMIIKPGEVLSINKAIGPRTADKGFVVAPVIADGKFGTEVGGGVSQDMTTLFNAAFFAGLDFAEYQSHSIYISRYPYGREATINFPSPDLKIKNTTPYSVMIWTTYTNTTITFTMYSTKYFSDVQQTNQTKAPSNVSCTAVRTERTRWYLDGRIVKDYVTARYRIHEGVNCDQTPEQAAGPTTTAAAPTTTAHG